VREIQSDPAQCHLDVVWARHDPVLSPLSQYSPKLQQRFLALRCDQTFDMPQAGLGTGASPRIWRQWSPRPGGSGSIRIAHSAHGRATRRALFDGASDGAFIP